MWHNVFLKKSRLTTTHDATIADDFLTTSGTGYIQAREDTAGGPYYLYRLYQSFDTSSIGGNNVTSVTSNIYGNGDKYSISEKDAI